jgi:hypothetical protein
MNIKEIAILIGVLALGYFLGSNNMLSRFLPSSG